MIEILVRISGGIDLVAIEGKYHLSCLHLEMFV